jgi:hypothetical protein
MLRGESGEPRKGVGSTPKKKSAEKEQKGLAETLGPDKLQIRHRKGSG